MATVLPPHPFTLDIGSATSDPIGSGTILALDDNNGTILHYQPALPFDALRAYLPAGAALRHPKDIASAGISLSTYSPQPGWSEIEIISNPAEGDPHLLPLAARVSLPESSPEAPTAAILRIDRSALDESLRAKDLGLRWASERVADCLPHQAAAVPRPCIAQRHEAADVMTIQVRGIVSGTLQLDRSGGIRSYHRIFLPRAGG